MNADPSPDSPLGPLVQAFQPSRDNLVAGGILGLLLLIAGGAFIVRAPPEDPKGMTFAYVLGAACVTGGLLFFAFTYSLALTKVELHEGGFRRRSFSGADDVTWDDVDLIQYHVPAEQNAGARVDPFITVWTEQRKRYRFTTNQVANMAQFVATMGQLTSAKADVWEETSKVSKQRWGVFLAVGGLFAIVLAPLTFLDIAQAEQNPGIRPVEVHWLALILYGVGGKWLAAAGLVVLGLGLLCWGFVIHRRAQSRADGRRNAK